VRDGAEVPVGRSSPTRRVGESAVASSGCARSSAASSASSASYSASAISGSVLVVVEAPVPLDRLAQLRDPLRGRGVRAIPRRRGLRRCAAGVHGVGSVQRACAATAGEVLPAARSGLGTCSSKEVPCRPRSRARSSLRAIQGSSGRWAGPGRFLRPGSRRRRRRSCRAPRGGSGAVVLDADDRLALLSDERRDRDASPVAQDVLGVDQDVHQGLTDLPLVDRDR
jgi:hypothetical protein